MRSLQLGLLLATVEVGIVSSHRDQESEALSSLMTLPRNGFQVLEKDPPEFQDVHIYISKGQRKDLEL